MINMHHEYQDGVATLIKVSHSSNRLFALPHKADRTGTNGWRTTACQAVWMEVVLKYMMERETSQQTQTAILSLLIFLNRPLLRDTSEFIPLRGITPFLWEWNSMNARTVKHKWTDNTRRNALSSNLGISKEFENFQMLKSLEIENFH